MRFTHTDYLELPAPFALTWNALRDPAVWAALPTGAERLGETWYWENELYTVGCEEVRPNPAHAHAARYTKQIRWQIRPIAATGTSVQIDIWLYDAVIATHATIRIAVEGIGPRRPWQYARLARRLVRIFQACSAQLQSRLITGTTGTVASVASTPAGVTAIEETTTHNLAAMLRERYPQTVDCFRAMQAVDQLERVYALEQGWQRLMRGAVADNIYRLTPMPAATDATDFDLIYVGGGLGLLHATTMACCYGWRVMLFDRGEVGCVQQIWNISRDELQALVDLGLVRWDELADVIMREYRSSLVRFYTSPYSRVPPHELRLPSVHNLALDAGALLRVLRRKLEAAGGVIRDYHTFCQVRVAQDGPLRVEVELEDTTPQTPGTTHKTYSARLLLDGMGPLSPLTQKRYAGPPFAGVCPTVGTVARGFVVGTDPDQYDPTIGEILVSSADSQHNHQLLWQGLPGRGDELAVTLSYYATLNDRRRPLPPGETFSLLDLFEHYFTLLRNYKQPGANFQHIKPVYGYLPTGHSMRSQAVPPLRGVVPIGDAAAQHNPLALSGFGAHVRNLPRTSSLLTFALHHNLLEPQHLERITALQTNVALTWGFRRFMHPWGKPHQVNELLQVFLGTLNDLGSPPATRFFQDQMRWTDYRDMLGRMLGRYPRVLVATWQALGPAQIVRWLRDYLRFSGVAAQAAVARLAGTGVERTLYRLAGRISPAWELRLRAAYAEWRVMGWVE
ncbi:MAG: hypothetical protein ACLFVO_03685 [Chloroflexaceae bacterium]